MTIADSLSLFEIVDSDSNLKFAVEYRLSEFRNKQRLNLDQPFEEMMMSIANCQELADDSPSSRFTLAGVMTTVTCFGVDAFKRSPIPGKLMACVSVYIISL
jgi:hypothetical protein